MSIFFKPFYADMDIGRFRVSLKYDGSFLVKNEASPNPDCMYYADRWSATDDFSREVLSSLPEREKGWTEVAGGVLYGLENEAKVWPEHIKEYYNLVILRPYYVFPMDALRAVEVALWR